MKDVHYRHLHGFLEEQLAVVVAEQKRIGDIISDDVDINVERKKHDELFKTCYSCGFSQIPRKKHTCTHCKASVTKGKMHSLGLDNVGNPMEETIDREQDHC